MAANYEGEPSEIFDTGTGTSAEQAGSVEALACVTCRSRKLKCDRKTPICSRCEKAGNPCVYPETRRKPVFKRRNVKDLEQRLAQVEGALKTANFSAAAKRHERLASSQPPEHQIAAPKPNSSLYTGHNAPNNPQPSELMGLGRFEALPPSRMIEELHDCFFSKGQPVVPMRAMIHRDRYIQAYYSAPHKPLPMCLQYAIWAIAASRLDKYARYHDVFYRRARHYLEADELKGSGEHFITIAHAQAWALLSIYEGGCMHFSRIAMSSAKCVRLVHVMGLHRLDDVPDQDQKAPISPAIPPPQDWLELEERRRLFWCAFCVDAHSSITTGWPSLMELDQITTHLPASEEAFDAGSPEKTPKLQDVFKGAQYSVLGTVVVNCHIFKNLLIHMHRFMPDDRPQDVESGPFWRRYRDLDNTLSNTFMFLPEKFRAADNPLEPVAVRTTLNLLASSICLHNSAWSMAEKFNVSGTLKKLSKARSLAAGQEILRIIKLVCGAGGSERRSISTPALYCAAATFIHQGMENLDECAVANLQFIVDSIEDISKQDLIARAYLNQLVLDIEQSGLSLYVKVPPTSTSHLQTSANHHTPLKPALGHGPLLGNNEYRALSEVTQAPNPPRLPFSARTGNTLEGLAKWNMDTFLAEGRAESSDSSRQPDHQPGETGNKSSSKRRRADTGGGGVPATFMLADNWFGQCAPLHFDPMNLPTMSSPVNEVRGAAGNNNNHMYHHDNLPHRNTIPHDGPLSHHLKSQEEDLLMATFTSLDDIDGSTCSASPVQQRSPSTFGHPSDNPFVIPYITDVHVHSYAGFATAPGANTNTPNQPSMGVKANLGLGVGGDVFPGLDVWAQMPEPPLGNHHQHQHEAQQQLYNTQVGAGGGAGDLWDDIHHQTVIVGNNNRGHEGGDGSGSGGWAGQCQ